VKLFAERESYLERQLNTLSTGICVLSAPYLKIHLTQIRGISNVGRSGQILSAPRISAKVMTWGNYLQGPA